MSAEPSSPPPDLTDPPDVIRWALARAVAGDELGAGMLLAPLIEDGYCSSYALAVMLAETASHIARREQPAGTCLQIAVDNLATGLTASVEVLPPDVRWAAQFVTAWANRDQDTAQALFDALVEEASASDGPEFVDGLLQLFAMAVITAKAVCAEERARRTTRTEGDA